MSASATVLMSVPHGAAAGNMLRHGLLARLLAADSTVRIVIASPMAKDPGFVREFAHPRVVFEDLPAHKPAGLEARLHLVVRTLLERIAVAYNVRRG